MFNNVIQAMVLIMQITAESILTAGNISVISVLIGFIVYLMNENKTLKKNIEKCINEHKDDLRKNNENTAYFLEKWNSLTNEIKDIIRKK